MHTQQYHALVGFYSGVERSFLKCIDGYDTNVMHCIAFFSGVVRLFLRVLSVVAGRGPQPEGVAPAGYEGHGGLHLCPRLPLQVRENVRNNRASKL